MEQKEYNVILNDGVDYDAFWHEMETQGHVSPAVPDRIVTIVDERPVSLRQCHYALTDDEVMLLKSDLRVYDVEIPPDTRTDLDNRHCAQQQGNFSQGIGGDPSRVNWGLFRCQYPDNSNVGSSNPGYYNYILDGTGVDVVIMDTGIQADHPDFQDANGVSRVQQIDWFAVSGVSGTMPANFYTDLDGHGTHCAGIAAGKTYGWAKNASIYAMHIPLSGDPGINNSIGISTAMDCMRGWHLNKPIDPATGARRPSIVNMSWGNFDTFTSFDGVEYRGNDYGGSVNPALGMVGLSNAFGGQNSTYDAGLSEMLDAGIHVTKAAGNNNNTVDVPGGPDFNNNIFDETFFIEYDRRYYQRGPSPRTDSGRELNVGALDSNSSASPPGDKAYYSNSGPGINVWAPGSDIISTVSTSNVLGGFTMNYPPNPAFKIMSLNGTSMAAPQVAGLLACFAQVWPQASVTWLRDKLIALAATNYMRETTQTDYTSSYAIHGGPNLVMYPGAALSTSVGAGIAGSVGITNITMRT
jgi:subtilisin family serine protease